MEEIGKWRGRRIEWLEESADLLVKIEKPLLHSGSWGSYHPGCWDKSAGGHEPAFKREREHVRSVSTQVVWCFFIHFKVLFFVLILLFNY